LLLYNPLGPIFSLNASILFYGQICEIDTVFNNVARLEGVSLSPIDMGDGTTSKEIRDGDLAFRVSYITNTDEGSVDSSVELIARPVSINESGAISENSDAVKLYERFMLMLQSLLNSLYPPGSYKIKYNGK